MQRPRSFWCKSSRQSSSSDNRVWPCVGRVCGVAIRGNTLPQIYFDHFDHRICNQTLRVACIVFACLQPRCFRVSLPAGSCSSLLSWEPNPQINDHLRPHRYLSSLPHLCAQPASYPLCTAQGPSKKRKLTSGKPSKGSKAKAAESKGKDHAYDRKIIPIPGQDDEYEGELSDQDFELLEEYGAAAGFLNSLDAKSIARQVVDVVIDGPTSDV